MSRYHISFINRIYLKFLTEHILKAMEIVCLYFNLLFLLYLFSVVSHDPYTLGLFTGTGQSGAYASTSGVT